MEIKKSPLIEAEEKNKNNENRNNSKIYFFIIAIIALLMTNVYFYVKYKSSGEKLYTIALQKENLQIEIDRIEAELDNIGIQTSDLSADKILEEEKNARIIIEDLRRLLEEGSITEIDLQNAKDQIQKLKVGVSSLKEEANEIRFQNEILKKENSVLNETVKNQERDYQNLKSQNDNLANKVTIASAIKVSNIIVNGVDKNRKGNFEIQTRAKRVENLQIKFSIADNSLAKKGRRDVFVRIIDPAGNLLANSENVFVINGDKIQYTFKENINFTNKGEEYEFVWNDSTKFKKGAYTILLYSDNSIMGRSSVLLK